MEYIELGSAPPDEECAQLGVDDDYPERSRIECRTWLNQLLRMLPVPNYLDGKVYYTVKAFNHDFGTYREVCVIVTTGIPDALDFAYGMQSKVPTHWDEEALSELQRKLMAAGLEDRSR